jgi:hypothetical protein
MDFKSFLSGSKSGAVEYYWALVIEPGWVQAGIWEIEGEKAKVSSISPGAAWETDEEIVGAADTALSAAIQTLPEDIGEPSKTVFGVPSSWVGDGQIKAEFLQKIKGICAELSLEPTGFVVLPEAIANLVKSEEGAPLNAVVIGMGGENIEISVFKLGNLVGNSVVARSVSIADDVAEGLTRFAGSEPLPSRILLYDGKEGELEEVRQNLLKVSWEEHEKVKFLHTPKIEIIEPDRKVLATALAGASEIANIASVEEVKKEFPQEEKEEAEIENVVVPQEQVSTEDLGFVVGEDVAKKAEVPQPMPVPAAPAVAPVVPTGLPLVKKVGGVFNKFKAKIIAFLTSKERVGGSSPSRNVLLLGGIVLGSVLVLGFVLWWALSRSTVTIYVSSKSIEEDTEVTFDTGASSLDLENSLIPAQRVETSVSGEKTKSTTGTKTVGERAKGTVTIRNGNESIINLAAGTILSGANDLKFNTNSSASISAAVSPSQPGTANVDITAADIGSEFNLAKDETFKVANYPKAQVDGVAVSNFSGGSSREISAVSEEDQEGLKDDLTNELLEKAKGELLAQTGEEKMFIEDSLLSSETSSSFSDKVGDEASTLKLNMELEVTGIMVDKKAFYEYAREVLKEVVPSGFALRDDQLEARFSFVDEDGGVYQMDARVAANLLPELKLEEIQKNIAGRNTAVAERYLTSIPGFSRAEIKISPAIFRMFKILPKIAKNNEIEILGER